MTRSIYKKSLKRKGRVSKVRSRGSRSRGRKTKRIVYRRRNINAINNNRRRIMRGGAYEYGYIEFGSDGYTLTDRFLRCFDLGYNGSERITIPSSFVSVWIDVKKIRRKGWLTSVKPENDAHLELKQVREIVNPWELQWRDGKKMQLHTRIEQNQTTKVEIKKKDNSPCLSVTTPIYKSEHGDTVEFLCTDKTTYPVLKLKNDSESSTVDSEISTQDMTLLINWGVNYENECFKFLSMFGIFTLLCTILNTKTNDINWKKKCKNHQMKWTNLKEEFPIHLLHGYDKDSEEEVLPVNPNQAEIDEANYIARSKVLKAWFRRAGQGYPAGPRPDDLPDEVMYPDGRRFRIPYVAS